MAKRSKARVCGRSLSGIAGSSPTGGRDVSLVSVVCWQVVICATGRSLVNRSPTNCSVSLCVIYKPQRMLRPWPSLGCCISGGGFMKHEYGAFAE